MTTTNDDLEHSVRRGTIAAMRAYVPTGPANLVPDYRRVPALDGLRASAIIIVLVSHCGLGKWVPGGFGVTLFFFISGLLITRLMLAEVALSGRFNVLPFYGRRMLRLYPALVFTVAMSYASYAWVEGYVLWKDVAAALLYISNYYEECVRFGSGYSPMFISHVHISILWSLAVEEQYYLMFPLIFVMLGRSGRRLLPPLIIIAVTCLIWRLMLATGGSSSGRIYGGTDTRLDSILYGALLTTLLAGPNGHSWLIRLTRPSVLLLSLVTLVACFAIRDAFFRDTFRYSLQGLAFMPWFAVLCFTDRLPALTGILQTAPMRAIGALSYSLYLTHQLGLTYAGLATGENYLDGFQALSLRWFVIAVATTALLTLISYFLIERRFIGLRYRLGSRAEG